MNESEKYKFYVEKAVNDLLILNRYNVESKEIETSTSGKITGSIFNIGGVDEYIHSLAKINNLVGTLHKNGLTIRYSYKGMKSNIDNFNLGLKNL